MSSYRGLDRQPGLTTASLPANERQNHATFTLETRTDLPSTLNASPSGPANTIHTFASGINNETIQGRDDVEQTGSYGTLLIGIDGRSKYLGPTAGSEWLKDSETQDVLETPLVTRAPTPDVPRHPADAQTRSMNSMNSPISFPFSNSPARISTRDLLAHLPPRDEAWTLVESYYRYCAWHHDVAPKARFELTFNRVYAPIDGNFANVRVDPQEIALVFIIMAQGTIFNIEMPYYDSSVEEWLDLSERALVKGEFLSNNTVAGVQALHLMAHLHLHLDKGRRGDNAWPLWGLVMRLIQAMGMHRDGTRWNLPQDVVEERRKVFWEVNSADIFQAHCFSRPSAINPEHCDTEFPSQPLNLSGEKTYFILRFELSQLSSEILNMAMKVRKPPYSDVMDMNMRICEFERNVPFALRSRAACLAMPSRFPQPEEALAASPEPSPRSMISSFQQMNLALNISETVINLHRPYYAKALYDDVGDRLNSVYAPSFLTVIERCALIINIVIDIHIRFPAVSNRQWNLWFHVFGCALCLGTLLLRDPTNPMSSYVLMQIDSAIDLFTSLIQHGAGTPRYRRNLDWLKKLRVRAFSKMTAAVTTQEFEGHPEASPRARLSQGVEDSEDVELLGWRTRLIERAGQARQTIRTIHHPATPTGSYITGNADSPHAQMDSRDPQGRLRAIQGMSIQAPPTLTTPDVTDDLLHGFWDPMLLQDILGDDHPDVSKYTGFLLIYANGEAALHKYWI
ncbi:hypothetical protein IQ07DRAFT_521681 [Pyrenochaeta sp. DS3sAY3a]|nr:hypothetical protein IQ07DRAFT_521681 [Pyrenochaeta sp. DS3sAY3a]